MEKQLSNTLFELPGGDTDDSIDWEDFIIIQGILLFISILLNYNLIIFYRR